MVPSLLILTDFFQAANRALDYATNLATPLGARLVLLHVRRDSLLDAEMFTGLLSRLSKQAVDMALSSISRDVSVPVVAEVGHGRVAFAVADAVSRHTPTLVVLGRPDTEGTPDELISTTSLDILRVAPYPMLVVPHMVHNPALPRRILMAVDGDEFTLGQHAGAIRQLLTALHAQVTVLRVTPGPATQQQADQALDSVVQTGLGIDLEPIRVRTLEAVDPTTGILQEARAEAFDLVVMIARRRSFLGQLFHRSVTAKVLLHSEIPIMVLPAQE
ncbi:universal stress protein [Hymenobacter tenuis]